MGFTNAFLTSLTGTKILTETGKEEGFVLLHFQQNIMAQRWEHAQESWSPVAFQKGTRIICFKDLTSVTYFL